MKLIKSTILFLFLTFPLMSCIDEPAQQFTTQEIISEIARQWTCNMDEDGFNVDFTAVITADVSSDSRILIHNFHKIGDNLSAYAIVNEDLTINLPEQTINNQIFKGSGLISDDFTEISWNYTIEDDNGTITNVTGKYTYGVSS